MSRRIDDEMAGFTGEYSVYCSDLNHSIEVNADVIYETASCIKAFILLALTKAIKDKKVMKNNFISCENIYNATGSGILKSLSKNVSLTVEDIATLMIVVSDNIATNIIIDLLSLDYINEIILGFGFKKTKLLNIIDFEIYHTLGQTTAREYGQLFEGFVKETYLDHENTKWMLDIFSKQHYQSMLIKFLPPALLDEDYLSDQKKIEILSKSGAMDCVRNDGGIIRCEAGLYVIAIFTKDFKDFFYHPEHESYRYGGLVSKMLFNHFISRGGSFE